MASVSAPAGFRTTQQVIDMASAKGLTIPKTTLNVWARDSKIRGAKVETYHDGRSNHRRTLIPTSRANEIITKLERQRRLLRTHITTQQATDEIKKLGIKPSPGFVKYLIGEGEIETIKDPFYEQRHLIPRGELINILFRALQHYGDQAPGVVTPKGVVALAKREGASISPTTVIKLLSTRKDSEAAQYLRRSVPLWVVSERGARKIVEYAKVKDRLGKFFTGNTGHLTSKEAAVLARDIAQARRVGMIFTFHDAERQLGLSRRALYQVDGVNTVTFGGRKYVTDKELERLRKVVKPRGANNKLSKPRKVGKKKKRRTEKK